MTTALALTRKAGLRFVTDGNGYLSGLEAVEAMEERVDGRKATTNQDAVRRHRATPAVL